MQAHSSCRVKLEVCMCVLNSCAPGDCVCLEFLYSCWRRRLVCRESGGSQQSCAFVFLAVWVGGLWQWRSLQSNKDDTPFTISNLSPQNKATQRTQFSVCWGGVCVSIPVKVRKMMKHPQKWGHLAGVHITHGRVCMGGTSILLWYQLKCFCSTDKLSRTESWHWMCGQIHNCVFFDQITPDFKHYFAIFYAILCWQSSYATACLDNI